MGEENQKGDLRIEDRRHFDREGNPIDREEQREQPPEEEQKSAAGTEAKTRPSAPSGPPPKIDFTSLIFVYVQTALVHLGELPEPGKDQPVVNLEAARQMIDTIELLQEKTQGNLSTQEDQYIVRALFDLRMLYVQKAKQS